MPPNRSKRTRQAQRQAAGEAAGRMRRCSYCPGLFSTYRGAWKIHEAKCKDRPGNTRAGVGASSPVAVTAPSLDSDSESDSDESEDGMQQASLQMSDGYWDGFGAHGTHNETMTGFHPSEDGRSDSDPIEQALDANGIPPLKEGHIWIKRHPASHVPSGFLTTNVQPENSLPTCRTPDFNNTLPPYYPFKSIDDFEQAEIFSDFGDTDKKINRQLRLASSTVSLKSAKDYHETLALAIQHGGGEFTSKKFTTNFEGQTFEHYIHFQPAFPALKRVVGDPDLAKHMVYFPEERWDHRPNTHSGVMRVWEELWHAKLWWKLQDRVHPNQCILYIVIYIDETHVSTIGGVHVWPIYAWIGNLPASIRKQRTKKGGAILLGYLPKARKDSKVKDLAGFRCKVYHDALSIVFESLRIPSQYGAPIRCGDGVIREFVPVIAAGSADYMEIIRMICILGHRSAFPCPICFVPRSERSKLTSSWPLRTVFHTNDILNRAKEAESTSPAESNKILKEQSLRSIRSVFLDIIPAIHSVYRAIIADPLHQIEQGVWGKHLWPWIRDQLPTASKEILDNRFKAIPRYPDLKHFPNGVTSLKIEGAHGVILKTIGPLLQDLLRDEYQELILGTFRTLATIHMLAKFTTHTDISLNELDKQVRKFDRLHSELVETFPDSDLTANYPKLHSLSHLVDIIRQHGTTDNYHTGLGEALHPQSKKDYRRTNHQVNFEVQMLRMHQEREAVIRIRARIDAGKEQDKGGEESSWDGPNVQLGSSDRKGRQSAPEFVKNRMRNDSGAQNMNLRLRTFVYKHVGGFGRRRSPRPVDLPSLNDMLVTVYHLFTVGYKSFLDSQLRLDVARVTDSWRNQGPRYDYAIVGNRRELFVAQLLSVFKLTVKGKKHSIAYVRHFKINGRSEATGYIELTDLHSQEFILTEWILRSCVVISPGIEESTHVLWDLEGPDMYLRLQNL